MILKGPTSDKFRWKANTEHTSNEEKTRREILQENDSLASVRTSEDNKNSAGFDGHYYQILRKRLAKGRLTFGE